MSVHPIRLRHPWRCEPLGKVVVWRRRFHRPTGLGPEQRIFLVVEGLTAPGTVTLNGQPLGRLRGEPAAQPFDVTGRLELGNELTLRLESPPLPDRPLPATPPGEVRLEIHRAEQSGRADG